MKKINASYGKCFYYGFLTSVIWGAINLCFFFIVQTMKFSIYYSESLSIRHSSDGIIFTVILNIILAICMFGFYFLGTKFVANVKLVQGFAVFISFHIVLIFLLYLAYDSEQTMLSLISWWTYNFDLLLRCTGNVEEYSSNYYCDSFFLNACLTLIPYLFAFLGLIKTKNAIKNEERQAIES